MKKYDLVRIVQEEVLSRLDEYMAHTTPQQQPSKIAMLPGAPFGGNLSFVLNNQAKMALRQWAILCKACQDKFGEPGNWPQSMIDVAQKLGNKVEQCSQPNNEITEDEDGDINSENPSQTAKRLGLVYGGYGYWDDPKTGQKSVAQTINGKLVKVAPDAEKFAASNDPAYSDPNEVPPLHADPSLNKQLDKETLKSLLISVKDRTDLDVDPETSKQMKAVFKEAGRDPYKKKGDHHISPRWNSGMNTTDVPYDANGEQTVEKLLAMCGDPLKLLRWLVSKLKKETVNGRQRILQYIGILFDKGLIGSEEAAEVDPSLV